MATIKNSLGLQDGMTGALKNMTGALNSVIHSFETLNGATINTQHIENAKRVLQTVDNEIDSITQSAAAANDGFAGWQKNIIVANQAVSLIKNTVGSLLSKLGLFDMSGGFARIDTMNNFSRTIETMTGNADAARIATAKLNDIVTDTPYALDLASKSAQGLFTRGMNLGKATTTFERFGDAVARFGDGSNAQLESVMDTVGKMQSSNRVSMVELRSLFNAGINAPALYAKQIGKTEAEVTAALSKGAISGRQFIEGLNEAFSDETIVGAAKSAGDSWAGVFANLQTAVSRGWADIIAQADAKLASAGLPSLMAIVQQANVIITSFFTAIGAGIDFVMPLFTLLYENWGWISEALLAGTVVLGSLAAAIGIVTAATAVWSATLWANPVTWIVAGVIALVFALIKLTQWIAKAQGTSLTAMQVVTGALSVAVNVIRNLFVFVYNAAVAVLTPMVNYWITIAEFIGNVFNDPVGSIIKLFTGMADIVLGVIQKIAKGIDFVFGSNMADTISGWRSSMGSWADKQINNKYSKIKRWEPKGMEYDLDIKKSWNNGIARKDKTTQMQEDYSILDQFGGSPTEEALRDTAGNTKRAADALERNNEELALLRNIAEREAINRFTTAEIKVEMNTTATVNSEMDLDGIVTKLEEKVEEALIMSAEGVHI